MSNGIPPQEVESQRLTSAPLQATPVEVIQQQASSLDYQILRYAVLGLVASVVVTLIGVFFLVINETPLPDGLLAIGSTAVGALATMLVRPPSAK